MLSYVSPLWCALLVTHLASAYQYSVSVLPLTPPGPTLM